MPWKKVVILFIMSYFSRLSVGRFCRFYVPKYLMEHWNLESWPIGPISDTDCPSYCGLAQTLDHCVMKWSYHYKICSKKIVPPPTSLAQSGGFDPRSRHLTFASMFKADSDSQALFNKSTIYVSVSQQDGNIKNHVAHRTLTLSAKTS